MGAFVSKGGEKGGKTHLGQWNGSAIKLSM